MSRIVSPVGEGPTVRIVDSVSGLEAEGWDDLLMGHGLRLPARDLYTSTRWLRRLEFSGGWDQQYLVASRSQTLVGGLVTHHVDGQTQDFPLRIDTAFGAGSMKREVIDHVLPCRVAGGLVDGRTGPRVRPGLSLRERASVFDELFAEAERIAETRGEKAVICRCVDAGDVLLRQVLRGRGYISFPGPRHLVLTPSAGGLEGYIANFPNRYRNMIRRELRKLREANVEITVEPLSRELVASVLPLIANLNRRYGLDENASDTKASLAIVTRLFKEDALAVVARVGDRPVGFLELVLYRDNIWAQQAGFDYEFQGNLPLYFGVLFYGLMDFVSSAGVVRVDFRTDTDEAKISRGCAALSTLRFIRLFDPAQHDRFAQRSMEGQPG